MYYCLQAVEHWHPLCWECFHVCFVYAVMATRAQLLSATVPMPDMSTSPSSVLQTETAKPCHPDSVAEMNIAPEVIGCYSQAVQGGGLQPCTCTLPLCSRICFAWCCSIVFFSPLL